jgi:hypothetical protein
MGSATRWLVTAAGIVAETRVKLYRSGSEQSRDEAEATSHGWEVVKRERLPSGTVRVTFQQAGSEWAAPAGGAAQRTTAVTGSGTQPGVAGLPVWAIVVVVGGVLAAVGTALPWISATAGFLSVSYSGLELGGGDAVVIAALGGGTALVGLLSVASRSAWWWLIALMGGLAIAGIGLVDYQDMQSRVSSVRADETGHAQVGLGMYAVLGGGVVSVVGALGMRFGQR